MIKWAEVIPDWVNWDIAEYDVAVALGIITSDWIDSKHIFWGHNPLGGQLDRIMENLVRIGVLEVQDDPDGDRRYRGSPSFKPQ